MTPPVVFSKVMVRLGTFLNEELNAAYQRGYEDGEAMRYAAKTDENQEAIVARLREMGLWVRLTHRLGEGFPDALVGIGEEMLFLVEIKNGVIGWKYTPAQKKFKAECPTKIHVLTSVEEATTFAENLRRLWIRRNSNDEHF